MGREVSVLGSWVEIPNVEGGDAGVVRPCTDRAARLADVYPACTDGAAASGAAKAAITATGQTTRLNARKHVSEDEPAPMTPA
jgi:hypothetical protein